ncbi:hypothetical protein [Rhizobium sp. BK602]|uniref:hypothetical protein n=1 Tax=Rhizobium sp. BK602 TaxID=2586986 RepID=UPI00160D1152|nr:hypothetical protein [Rhizobium sp. BK602]MBB3607349.1 hypothetical protein [Rhizobium sp. BK602]
MRRIILATFACVISGNAHADYREEIHNLAIQVNNATYSSLTTAYICRNVAGIDTYLKVRQKVEAVMARLSSDAGLVRETIGSWETLLQKNRDYKNPGVTEKECTDALSDRDRKLDAALNAMLDIRGDR